MKEELLTWFAMVTTPDSSVRRPLEKPGGVCASGYPVTQSTCSPPYVPRRHTTTSARLVSVSSTHRQHGAAEQGGVMMIGDNGDGVLVVNSDGGGMVVGDSDE